MAAKKASPKELVQQVRQLEEQGQLTIVRGDACDVFV
jgi:hypothetical protein